MIDIFMISILVALVSDPRLIWDAGGEARRPRI
jgi:uncharacterized paraquat-inducible protein A